MNNKENTLVILTPGFAASEADTTCMPPQQVFVNALKKNDPSLNIIVLAFQYPYKSDSYLWNGIKIISFNGIGKNKFRKIVLWVNVWNTLRKLKHQYNITGILNFWLGECALTGKYFGRLNKIKQFTWLLGQDAKEGNKFFSIIKPRGSELIALSDFIAEQVLINYGITVAHTIPVGIDSSMFSQSPHERGIDVLGAGSLIPLKRYDLFIYGIKELTFHFPKIRAMICGKGPQEKKLQALIRDLSLTGNIILAGELPHGDVIRLMQRSKILLHPSSYEGFGSVCAEALYAGCHVISFCKPMKEQIEQWHVVKTEPEMKQKMLEILQQPHISHKPVTTYAIEDTAGKMMSLFGG